MHIRKIEQQEVFMNTSINIRLYSDRSTVYSHEKIQKAFGCFANVVEKYTRFDPNSELSLLNNSSGKPHKVSKEFYDLIEYMLQLSEVTKGSYDPTIIDLLETYGYKSTYDLQSLDDPELLNKITALVKVRAKPSDIILNSKDLTVLLAKRQRLDLGSIGKGYAVDLAFDVLKEFPAVMINAGGDIRVKGPKPDGEAWKIGLYYGQLPNQELHQESSLGTIDLVDGSVSGSGGWARKVKFFHHLLDPQTGIPINEVSQTYVLAPSALESDAWSTVLFTMGEKGLSLLEERGYQGLVVLSDGKISITKNFPLTN